MAAALNQQRPEMDLFPLFLPARCERKNPLPPRRVSCCRENPVEALRTPLAGPGRVTAGRSRQAGLHVW